MALSSMVCRVVREAQEAAALPSAVPACSFVEVHIAGVAPEAAEKLLTRIEAFCQVRDLLTGC